MKTLEADHQKAVIEWASWHEKKWPCLKYLYACPNEGMHKVQYRVHQKAMGVKAGVPDLFLPYPVYNENEYGQPDTKFHGLFIEMKAGDNKPTDAQWDFIDWLKRSGYQVAVCWSSNEAIKVIEEYLR